MANKSTGPRSDEGKARSSMNALKTGIYSKSLILPGEDTAALDALTAEFHQHYHPSGPLQRELVDILVRCSWELRRYAVAESQFILMKMRSAWRPGQDTHIGHAVDIGITTLTRLKSMQNTTHRNFRNTLRELERLQALNPPPTPAAPGPIPVPDPPKPIENPTVSEPETKIDETHSPPRPPRKTARPKPVVITNPRLPPSRLQPQNTAA